MWQPIETAPKTGSSILLATPKGRIADGFWSPAYGVWSWPYVMVEPTHWMPLPGRPNAQAQPAPSVPREAIEKMLTQLMDIAVSNGANSVSMPDEYVEVAAWLCGIPAQPAPSFADAYQGAVEEVAIWKKRALEAEDLNRKFTAEINGPTYMGEPAQPAPSVPDGWKLVPIDPTRNMLDIMDLGSNMLYRYRALLAAAPEAKQ